MQYTNPDLISHAYKLVSKKWILAIVAVILVGLISNLGSAIDEKLAILNIFLSGALAVGSATFFLKIVRGQEERIEDIFEGFKTNYVATLVATIVSLIVVMLGFIALIIPGVILGLGLSQTYYILAEDKEISGIDAMKKSWEMMDGWKMKYFLLCLLYFGMGILGLLALVVGLLFVIPIISTSNALFYEKLKTGQLKQP
ncbi:DUF975 family protein [Jiulongibacter sediminis]|uniref:Glycerophosphoryl diester phosphodiesterase membrane domain-containing protein n=1 Tax=Jiulongibacter sediminis TaxID=1605367 RepID=A0A0N8HA82_9BACT|nr:DUF975 family protein [Jiulongibacter sediminis]KPM49444.1 hypothetical protein AFM12_02190 [Jiulongibacter sediminis]TBX26493.1 hypothetical protein TK44_02195 [Jiulongibacter sediminis]